MKRWLGRSPGQVLGLLGFALVCAVWVAWQVHSVAIGCDGERYFLAGRAMASGLDPYALAGPQTYLPYPPFLAWAIARMGFAAHPWAWQLLIASSAVVLLYATLALAGLGKSRLLWLGTVLLAGQSFAGDLGTSNVQLPVVALLALTLLAVDRGRFAMGGVLCGIASGLKLTPVLLIVLMAARAPKSGDRRLVRFSVVGSVIAAASLVTPWTWRWLQRVVLDGAAGDSRLSGANLSWTAVMAQAGIPLPALVPSLLALIATIVVARARRASLLPSMGIAVALSLAGAPVAWGFTYLTLLPAIAVLVRELRQGRHVFGEARGRTVAEYGSVLVFTMFAVNADFFYLHDAWLGRQVLPLLPLSGTLLLVWALWRTQSGTAAGAQSPSARLWRWHQSSNTKGAQMRDQ